MTPLSLPLLDKIPFLGEVFFSPQPTGLLQPSADHCLCWWYFYRTPYGLKLRSVGEHPRASYARGISPEKLQLFYAVCGGLFVGLAGATFSLATKPGWGRPQGAEGNGLDCSWHLLSLAVGILRKGSDRGVSFLVFCRFSVSIFRGGCLRCRPRYFKWHPSR